MSQLSEVRWEPTRGAREITPADSDRFNEQIRTTSRLHGSFQETEGRVHRLDRTTVLKSGGIRITEALTMDFIARNTTIPVPLVRDVCRLGDRIFILMEYIEGCTLREAWRGMNQTERLDSLCQLRGYIEQLRHLSPPDPQSVQAVDGGSIFDGRMHGEYGPYASIEKFNEAWGHTLLPSLHPTLKPIFEKTAGRSWRTVFAHGDLAPHNILWKDGKIVAIIDWESAGWLPEYWDYTRAWEASYCNDVGEEWWKMFQEFTECYPDELEVEKCVDDLLERF